MSQKRYLLVLVVLAMLAGVQKCAADGASEFTQGKTYQKAGQYEQAEAVYQSVVSNYPGTNYALQSQKRIAIVNIKMRRFDAVDAAVNKLKTDFASEPNLPAVLYSVAKTYEISKHHVQRAQSLYQYIGQSCSGPFAEKSQLDSLKINILGLIEADDLTGAASAVSSLKTSYSDNSYLPTVLYMIGKRHDRNGVLNEAAKTYQGIIDNYSGSSSAAKARLDLRKVQIFGYIEADDANSVSAVSQLVSEFSSDSYLPAVLWLIAEKYERCEQYAAAKSLSQQIVQNYPNSPQAKKAAICAQKNQLIMDIDAGQAVESGVNQLIMDFSDNPDLPLAVLRIAEQYYTKAQELERDGQDKQTTGKLEKAAAMGQMVIDDLEACAATGYACYFTGDCYRLLGQYADSVSCYEKFIEEYPADSMTWNSLFMVGRGYQNLKAAGTVEAEQADAKIRTAYQRLVDEYPDCPAANAAQKWLEKN